MAGNDQPTQGTNDPPKAGDPNVIASLGLGWHMAEMYGVVPVPSGPEKQEEPDKLAGLDDLSSYRRQLLGLDQVDFALTKLNAAASWPDASKVEVPDTAPVRSALEAIRSDTTGGTDGRSAYRAALVALHLQLLVTVQAADPAWGSAYRLGRGLADTTLRMNHDEVKEAFRDGRIGNLVAATSDLATLLPDHAGKAVAESLGWWLTEVSEALQEPTVTETQATVRVTGDDTPRRRAALEARRREKPISALGFATKNAIRTVVPTWKATTPTIPRKDVSPLHLDDLRRVLPRQGRVWRGVLTGETAATDRLNAYDYLEAAKGFAEDAYRLARKAPPIVWALFVGVVLASVGAMILIGIATTGSAAGRSAAGLGGLIAALLAGWKVIKARTLGAFKQLEEPLWGAELDRAIADAITLPPVGAGEPDRWTELAIDGAFQAAQAVTSADTGQSPAPTRPTPEDGSGHGETKSSDASGADKTGSADPSRKT